MATDFRSWFFPLASPATITHISSRFRALVNVIDHWSVKPVVLHRPQGDHHDSTNGLKPLSSPFLTRDTSYYRHNEWDGTTTSIVSEKCVWTVSLWVHLLIRAVQTRLNRDLFSRTPCLEFWVAFKDIVVLFLSVSFPRRRHPLQPCSHARLISANTFVV